MQHGLRCLTPVWIVGEHNCADLYSLLHVVLLLAEQQTAVAVLAGLSKEGLHPASKMQLVYALLHYANLQLDFPLHP